MSFRQSPPRNLAKAAFDSSRLNFQSTAVSLLAIPFQIAIQFLRRVRPCSERAPQSLPRRQPFLLYGLNHHVHPLAVWQTGVVFEFNRSTMKVCPQKQPALMRGVATEYSLVLVWRTRDLLGGVPHGGA